MNSEPPRLSGRDDATGLLLRAANAAYRAGSDEEAAWRRLRQRLSSESEPSRSMHWSWWLAPLAAAAGLVLYLRVTPEPVEPPGLVAEPEPVVSAPISEPSATAPAQPSTTAEPRRAPPMRRVVDCSLPLAASAPRDAAFCLEQRANGVDLGAERALVELATLRRERLNDPHGAIAALRSHRQRFPDGALRGEVDFALLELLPEVGRSEEALAESAALLEKPWGRARVSQLRLTRGILMQDRLNDCAGALQEYAAVRGEYGPTGDEAEFRSASCLERLGDFAQAERVYSSYLARQSARREVEARQRRDAILARRESSGER